MARIDRVKEGDNKQADEKEVQNRTVKEMMERIVGR